MKPGLRTSLVTATSLLFLLGCGVADNDPDLWKRVDLVGNGAGGGGGNDGSGSVGAAVGSTTSTSTTTGPGAGSTGSGTMESGPCSMTFTVTNEAYGGKYSPKNVGAIWIETSSGQFVKSLEVWGAKRLKNATHWTAISGGNKVDAITSATLSNYKTHPETWDCSDVNGATVPDGAYHVAEEFTSDNSSNPLAPQSHYNKVEFIKSAEAQTITPPDAPGFASQTLTFQ